MNSQSTAINLMQTRMIKLTPDRNHLPADSSEKAHAILLPDFGLIFPNIASLEADKWANAVAKGNDHQLFERQCAMPEVEELMIIPNRRMYPAIDRTCFSEIQTDHRYWTATRDPARPSDRAYLVYFNYGLVKRAWQYYDGLVLPVLRVPAGQSSAFGF